MCRCEAQNRTQKGKSAHAHLLVSPGEGSACKQVDVDWAGSSSPGINWKHQSRILLLKARRRAGAQAVAET
jgi:hypothetical protein